MDILRYVNELTDAQSNHPVSYFQLLTNENMGKRWAEMFFEEITYESNRIKKLREKIKSAVYSILDGRKKKK